MIRMLARFSRWLQDRIGSPTLVRLALLWLSIYFVGRGLTALALRVDPRWAAWTAIVSVLFAWLLARTRLPGWKSALASAGLGLLWLTLTIGRLAAPIGEVLSTLLAAWRQMLRLRTPDLAPSLEALEALGGSLQALSGRLLLWFGRFSSGALITDPIVSSLLWGLVFWLAAAWAAWWLRRRDSAGVGLLPAAALLAVSVFSTNSSTGVVWLVLAGGCWVLLQAAQGYHRARLRWQQRRIDRAEVEPLLALTAFLLAGSLMLAGGLLPSISLEKIRDSIQRVLEADANDRLAEALGLRRTPIPEGPGGASVGQSTTHIIRGGAQLSQDVIMYVTVEGYTAPPPIDLARFTDAPQPEVRYYWRAQTFDRYNGHVWSNFTAPGQEYPAGAPLYPDLEPLLENSRLVRQQVERLQGLGGTLFVAGDLLGADQPLSVSWRGAGDLAEARTDSNIYLAESRLPFVTVEQLRQAGSDYPASIQRYLALPDDLPQRVSDLAISLTLGLPTPYDRAEAIESYLRQFPYTLDVPGPPVDQEVTDYFLFDLKRGYCDYYATSMVVLARAAGLPARLVIGYTSGGFDELNRRFVVRGVNAHAWAEVYFPGVGWVEFEPTAGQPRLPRPGEQVAPSTAVVVPTPQFDDPVDELPLDWETVRGPLQTVGLALGGVLLLLLLPVRDWLLYLRPAGQAIPIIYHRLYRRGSAWDLPADSSRTPHEFAAALAAQLERLAGNQRLAPHVGAARRDLEQLTDLYTRLLFSPRLPTSAERHQAVRSWRRIRRGLSRLQRW